jgi:putative aminopeptidase FrvX
VSPRPRYTLNPVIPRTLHLLALLAVLATTPWPAHAAETSTNLSDEIEAFLHVPAVAGREEMARDFVRQRLEGLPAEVDRAGNLVLTVGSGAPKRLVTCILGEPGYVVSGIEPDGYLRLFPSGEPSFAPLWDQSHEGNVVAIGGSGGLVPGAVAVRSVHLEQEPPLPGAPPPHPFRISEAWVDVGAESAAEVAELGIRLLDPVALIRRPVRLAGGLVAGPSARQKGACIAQLEAARALSRAPGQGTVVFAWTVNDRLNPASLTHLVRTRGPFDEVVRLSALFGWSGTDTLVAEPLPRPGSGLLGSGQIPAGVRASEAPHLSFPPLFGEARVALIGLPALYPDSQVEAISGEDVDRLADALLAFAGGRSGDSITAPPLPPPPALAPPAAGHEEVTGLLARLIAQPGVSGSEGPIRDEILRHLPAWAKPETDEQGNLLVTFGQGEEHSLFIAHMDEVGFRVTEILPDGRLKLETRGGLLPYVWEGQAALVHNGQGGSVPAVFEPREDWRKADRRNTPGPLTASLGVGSPREAEALGVRVGSTVTMPKSLLRLGRHRGVARAFDDRNGCTALLLALRQIDPAKLRRKVTFAWVVEEEIGLIGSKAIAERMTGLTRVHPVDTFVSSDSPRENRRFAYTPLGKGVVLRTMDNASLVPRELIDRFQALAGRAGIPVQVGVTGGASDGVAFLPNGVEMIPFSWPGRSSHSPVEISDLRDVESLIRLIVATVTE